MAEEIEKPQAEIAPPPPVTEPPVTAPPEPPVDEPFDKDRAMATIHKLRENEKQYKQDKKELERLKADEQKRIEAQMSETEREKKRADELAAKNAKLESDLLRREVIEEVGLPGSFASRLQGATKEELLADAKELAKTLPQLKIPPKVRVTNPENSQVVETEAQKRERLFGKQGNVFDMESIKAKGGGVIINK